MSSPKAFLKKRTSGIESPIRQSYNVDFEKLREKRFAEAEKKREEDEEFAKSGKQNRYDRLMRLVCKSREYVNLLINNKPIKIKNDNNNNKPKVLQKRIATTGTKRKMTESEIEEFLNQPSSDEECENVDPNIMKSNENIDLDTFWAKIGEKYKESSFFKGRLYNFQKTGVQWMLKLHENNLNGILADEMGLGKTIQIIALFSQLAENKESGQHIVIAPLPTLNNWMTEFKKFAPELKVFIYHGKDRDLVKDKIKQTYTLSNGLKTKPIILTNYETVLSQGSRFLSSIRYNYIVIDEGQRIKNHKSNLARTLQHFKAKNRLLLTGTPVQNNLIELYSLLHFILPNMFNEIELFVAWFDVCEFQNSVGQANLIKLEKEKNVISSFREILSAFMLRRLKDDVGLDIPRKKEVVVFCPLTEIQHKLYRAVLDRDIGEIFKSKEKIHIDEITSRPKRLCRLMKEDPQTARRIIEERRKDQVETTKRLWENYIVVEDVVLDYLIQVTPISNITNYRKIVNHPYLLYQPLQDGSIKIDEETINQSGKMMVLDKMLTKLYAQGHKVLLFSCWTQILDVIEDYLTMKPYNYCRMDGKISNSIDKKQQSIDEFNLNPDVFLFLITTKSGGVGLNLVTADTVIIFDCDWNPQVDLQAMARCHRIGQTRPVMIYRLCTRGTIDEEILNRGDGKLKLEQAVISKVKRENDDVQKFTVERLMKIFKSSNSSIVKCDEQAITDEELEKILDRSELQ